ncbi:hypothetical protein [Paenibacillus sp. TC-CSREp1]|uniref:hypothetical protein n=1 Tax=Paenibacillus sp. TC-CSREp1 TaxID=3410089 RepID=UPI003CF9BEEA
MMREKGGLLLHIEMMEKEDGIACSVTITTRIMKPDSPFQDDIVWSVKASVRIAVYRSPEGLLLDKQER